MSAMQTQDSGFILAGWKKLLCEGYFFSWDNVTINDNEELRQFLINKFNIVMAKTDRIEKIDDNKTFKISSQEKSLYLKLNDEKTKLNIMINDGRTDEFLTNTENGKISICRPGSYEAWLLKTDTDGNEQWNLTFGGNDSDGATTVAQTSDGGYVLAGNTRSFGSGNDDAWLIKIAGGAVPSQTEPYIVEKPIEKSTPGFEIFATISSIMILYSKRKKA